VKRTQSARDAAVAEAVSDQAAPETAASAAELVPVGAPADADQPANSAGDAAVGNVAVGDVAAVDLGESLVAAWHIFTRLANARFAEHRLTAARVRLIVALASGPGVRMGALADQLGVTGRAVTALVDALEAEGVIVRKMDPHDRRAIQLRLTDRGRDLVAEIRRLQVSVSEELFRPFADAERRELSALLNKFVAAHFESAGTEEACD
jgi:DNA-binding MarR family transcriptional regulator